MSRKKYVTIESHGNIAALGGILGPITTPFYLDITTIIAIINSGKIVYEVNPKNIKDRTLLTRNNVLSYIYGPSSSSQSNTKPIHNEVKKEPPKEPITMKSMVKDDSGIRKNNTKKIIGNDLFISNKSH